MKNTLKISAAVCCLLVMSLLSGCFDFEFPTIDLSAGSYYGGGYGGGGGYGYPPFTISEMNLDSAHTVNDSLLFWASLHFSTDTILFVQRYQLIWYEMVEQSPGIWASIWPVGNIISLDLNDTIDFKSNNMEPFVITLPLPMDSLKTNTHYYFNPSGSFTTPDAKMGALTGQGLMKRTE